MSGAGPEAFTVRILRADGVAVGIGALVSDRHVVTCAHVVNAALGLDKQEQAKPTRIVALDFPWLDGAPQVQASVELWLPPRREGAAGDDIAGLTLSGSGRAPEGAVPARLAVDLPRPGRTVRVFGVPASRLPHGNWVKVEVQGAVPGGRLQLDSISAQRVEEGFSGSPVFDAEIGQVVGLIALAPVRATERDSYAIGAERLRLAWPEVLDPRNVHSTLDGDRTRTILHVSGLRMSVDSPAGRLSDDLSRLAEDHLRLQQDPELRRPPDLLVVTGDLTEHALPSEYRQAARFITGLAAIVEIPRRHVAIVPGSRDVNLMACQAYFAERRSREAKPVPPYYPKWNEFAHALTDFYADLHDAAHMPVTFTPDEPWTLLPDGKYKLEGDPGDRLWWAMKLCRFQAGELDPYVPEIERLGADAPLP